MPECLLYGETEAGRLPLDDEFDYIASDGMGPIKLNTVCGRPKSVRLSFDLSTMAGPVFREICGAWGEPLCAGCKTRRGGQIGGDYQEEL
mgnify:CR=1 FL=1